MFKKSLVFIFFALSGMAVTKLVAQDLAQEPWEKPAELYRAGEYKSAYIAAEAALKEHPNDPVLLRLMGMCLLDAGYPDQAAAWLREAVILYPESVSMAFYLAHAYASGGYYDDALKLSEQIIAHAPDSEYAERCRIARPELLSLQQHRGATSNAVDRFDLYIRVGWEYDDNVPARAKNDPVGDPQGSGRWTSSTYMAYSLIEQQAGNLPFSFDLVFSGYASLHDQKEYEAYNVKSYSPGFAISSQGILASRYYFTRVSASSTHTQLDNEDYSQIEDMNGSIYLQVSPNWTLGVLGGYYWKDFDGEVDYPEYYDLDGEEWVAGISSDQRFFKDWLQLTLGYGYASATTGGSQFIQESHSGNGSLNIIFPYELTLLMGLRYQQSDYPDFLPEPERLDDIWTFNATLVKSFQENRYNIELSYTAVSASSNMDYAEYDATIAGLALSLNL
ncbi:tetratricopeptide repeat protein [Kiritimatiellota bacterium B12222]|nr:tetratricopeptide repeat protein [Kiritimatiellota bacterium B12222]